MTPSASEIRLQDMVDNAHHILALVGISAYISKIKYEFYDTSGVQIDVIRIIILRVGLSTVGHTGTYAKGYLHIKGRLVR